MEHGAWMAGLGDLPRLRAYRSRRVSSYDRTGGNRDWIDIEPGQRRVFAAIDGPGCIRHIWMTMLFADDWNLRRVVLRVYWDGCPEPSVECPIGDFFGLGHAMRKDFHTAVLSMSPQDGRGFNSFWPMPFARSARLEIDNREGTEAFPFYFYVDYEQYADARAVAGLAYFHVQWRRENPTTGWGEEYEDLRKSDIEKWKAQTWFGGDPRSLNTTGQDNYVILEAAGDGIWCGAHLDIDIFQRQKNDWYGEGDDMVFIDEELEPLDGVRPVAPPAFEPIVGRYRLRWPPAIHGTGTEDWCNTAFGPHTEFVGPYHGVLLHSKSRACLWWRKQTIYRYYVLDPIRFRQRICATIEHGHANKLSNDYSSTAYYYLATPRRGGPPLPPAAQRLPRPDDA